MEQQRLELAGLLREERERRDANTVRATFASAINSLRDRLRLTSTRASTGRSRWTSRPPPAGTSTAMSSGNGDDDQRERPDLRRRRLEPHGDRRRHRLHDPPHRLRQPDRGQGRDDGAGALQRDRDPGRVGLGHAHGRLQGPPEARRTPPRRRVDHCAAEQRHGQRHRAGDRRMPTTTPASPGSSSWSTGTRPAPEDTNRAHTRSAGTRARSATAHTR